MQFRENFSSGLFSIGERGGKHPWFYHQHGMFVGRDPKATISITLRGLSITIPHYSLSGAGADDHLKFVFWRNEVDRETGQVGTKVPPHGMLTYEVRARAEALGATSNPFATPGSDYRLSCGAVLSTDRTTHTGCHFFFTATHAYAAYERYLFMDREKDPGAFFCYVIPVIEFPAGTDHTYRITYVQELNSTTWSLDGKVVLSIANVGQRLGADQEQYSVFSDLPGSVVPSLPPDHRIFGAGLLTLLDAGNRIGKGLVDLDRPDTPRQMKIFGQGGKIVVSEITIGTE